MSLEAREESNAMNADDSELSTVVVVEQNVETELKLQDNQVIQQHDQQDDIGAPLPTWSALQDYASSPSASGNSKHELGCKMEMTSKCQIDIEDDDDQDIEVDNDTEIEIDKQCTVDNSEHAVAVSDLQEHQQLRLQTIVKLEKELRNHQPTATNSFDFHHQQQQQQQPQPTAQQQQRHPQAQRVKEKRRHM